ncbi:MAG TPA: transketolase [Candidatus Krumholzibacteria bacterium]|nr:transketolase [Candidatus Krumholzibacteria bacterium]
MNAIDRTCIDTIRFLAVDAVEKARSGHPGMPMGAAPMAYSLWDRVLRHNPGDPLWFDRDRFVLSAGHGSMLLYALLHLYGYDLPLEEIVNFRQWGSRTPGHPEFGHTPGVEATTGPLGQGFAMGVGMAMAEAHLAAKFNPSDGPPVVDHYVFGIVSDGDLMEGIASEAASLAGTLRLGKIVYLYDNNHISIDGSTSLAFTEDVEKRFEAYGWHVESVEDGNDVDAIEEEIRSAQDDPRPSLICVHTHIGYGSPREDSEKAHGEPLGPDNVRAAKEKLGWPAQPLFHIPDEVRAHCRGRAEHGAKLQRDWSARVYEYGRANKARAERFKAARDGVLKRGWDRDVVTFDKPIATRAASGKTINALADRVTTMMGGSADLTGSNNTRIESSGTFAHGAYGERNIHFGVREHAMGAILNGMALHGGVLPFAGTFLIFSDYMRPAIRLSALMGVPSTFVFTHDSIGLGEDGPTHQPVEQLASLRAIPGLTVFRPADANETAAAWTTALTLAGPRAFALTRQALPILECGADVIRKGVAKGAYVVAEAEGKKKPDVVLIATGSEVHLALEARGALAYRGIAARVVSMPSWELFRAQSPRYRNSVLPKSARKVAVEAGCSMGWREWVGDKGAIVALDRFGASAPAAILMEKLGFSVENVVNTVLGIIGKPAKPSTPAPASKPNSIPGRV